MPYTTINDFVDTPFDYVIVGGGTAGLVLAARLSEKKNVSVGVIEAGISRLGDPKVDLPTGAALMLGNEDYDWNFRSIPQVSFSPYPAMCLLTNFLATRQRARIGCTTFRVVKCLADPAPSISWPMDDRVQRILMIGPPNLVYLAGLGMSYYHISRRARNWKPIFRIYSRGILLCFPLSRILRVLMGLFTPQPVHGTYLLR